MQRKIHHSTQTMAKAKFEMNTEGWVPDPRPCFFKTIHPDQCKEYLVIDCLSFLAVILYVFFLYIFGLNV